MKEPLAVLIEAFEHERDQANLAHGVDADRARRHGRFRWGFSILTALHQTERGQLLLGAVFVDMDLFGTDVTHGFALFSAEDHVEDNLLRGGAHRGGLSSGGRFLLLGSADAGDRKPDERKYYDLHMTEISLAGKNAGSAKAV